ncbi:hypothetical protein [Rhizobium sp. AG855]|nr:hypothetical protein [Rhizobium sp. AG855]
MTILLRLHLNVRPVSRFQPSPYRDGIHDGADGLVVEDLTPI